MRNSLFTIVLALMVGCGFAIAKEPLRIDGSSVASTEASWNQMMDEASPGKKRLLTTALFKLKMAGVTSAHQVIDDPNFSSVGIADVRDKVAGLTAKEIIDLGNRISTVTVEPK